MYYFKLIGVKFLFINISNVHHLGSSFIKYTFEKKPKYPITAENEPCDNIIFLQVLPNWIVSIGFFSHKIKWVWEQFILCLYSYRMELFGTKNLADSTTNFCCQQCDYKTDNKYYFAKHKLTRKHLNGTNGTKKIAPKTTRYFCKLCIS